MKTFRSSPCLPSSPQSSAPGPCSARCARMRCGRTWDRCDGGARVAAGGGKVLSVEMLGACGDPFPWRGNERSFRGGARTLGSSVPEREDPGSPLPNCHRNKAVRSGAGLAGAGGACVRGQKRRGRGRQALKTSAWQN